MEARVEMGFYNGLWEDCLQTRHLRDRQVDLTMPNSGYENGSLPRDPSTRPEEKRNTRSRSQAVI